MSSFRNLVCFFLFIGVLFTLSHAASFWIRNKCPYTVWAAATPVGGGRQLTSGQSWTINFKAAILTGRIWGRTNCNFNGTGHGRCQTGDCNGLLQCQGHGSPKPPYTLAEFSLNQLNNTDFYDISLVAGFNIPMDFSPTTGGCKKLSCSDDINGECPSELRAPGGCNNPCAVFNTNNELCCTGGGSCNPTDIWTFFKKKCPNAYSYPVDDPTSLFTCTSGDNYKVVFCP